MEDTTSTASVVGAICHDDSESLDEIRTTNFSTNEKNDNKIVEPSENDVLCGRGGSINSHPGNERFRILVEKRKRVYLTARFKREKRLIASSIVSEIAGLSPPGRFLSRDGKSGLWEDIGEEKARDKTSQALRENAPSIRAEIETEINKERAGTNIHIQDDPSNSVRVEQPTPVVVPSYYSQPWGYLYYSYGYSPNPPMPQVGMPPPPPPGIYHIPTPIPVAPHSTAPYNPTYHGYATTPDPYLHPPTPMSAIEQTANLVSSHAELFKNWTKNSLSFGGGVGTVHSNEGPRSLGSKPISYKHEDGLKRRRIVKFRDDDSSQNTRHRIRQVKPCYSPLNASDSLIDNLDDDENDLEPHNIDMVSNQDNSLIAQVANYLTPAVGSWDLATIVCGHDTSDAVPFPTSSTSSRPAWGIDDGYCDDDEAVEWEGQEVQLVDDKKLDPTEKRYPAENHTKNDNSSSVAFSSLGSCHSWLPENFGNAASYFNYGRGGECYTAEGGSMEMDYSTGGSLGGHSLSRVFENEPYEEGLPPISPNMNARVLSRVPSWERSLRSKSPLSIASDDESLVSKTSSKYEDESVSAINLQDTRVVPAIDNDDKEGASWMKE